MKEEEKTGEEGDGAEMPTPQTKGKGRSEMVDGEGSEQPKKEMRVDEVARLVSPQR